MLKRAFGKAQLAGLALCLCIVAALPHSNARAGSGFRALDISAIRVKAPNRVALISVTSAGNRLVSVGEHGVIAYSDDNGQSWKQSAVPVNVTLTAVAFADARDGWAVGHSGVILHTGDGGLTWQIQLNGLEANQLTLDAAKAAAADHDPSPGAPLALKRAGIFQANGADKPFLSLIVSSPRDVIVFGAYRMAMKTTDGGKTWMDWDLHIGDPVSHNLYNAVAIGNGIYVVGEAGSVFLSTDGGNMFKMLPAPSDATLLAAVPTGDGGIVVCGVSGQAFRSADDGITWQAINLGTQANLTAALVLKSGAILVAGEDGNLFISRDHGKSFQNLPTVQPMSLYDMALTVSGDVAMSGSGGVYVVQEAALEQSGAGD